MNDKPKNQKDSQPLPSPSPNEQPAKQKTAGDKKIINGATSSTLSRLAQSELDKLLADLQDADAHGRINAIKGIADKCDIPAQALLEVVDHMQDKEEWDPNPGSIGLPIIPKYVPTVSSICREYLPRIAVASPAAVHELIREYATFTEERQSNVRDALLAVGEQKLDAILTAAGDKESRSLRQLLDMAFFPCWTTPQAKTCFSLSRRDPASLVKPLDLLKKGLLANAIPVLGELARTHLQDPFCLALLARSYEESGAPEQAVSAWKDAAKSAGGQPAIAEWATKQAARISAAQQTARQALDSADLAAMPLEKMKELLERIPADVLSKVVHEEGSHKNFSAALENFPASRVESWGALFAGRRADPRWTFLERLTSSERSRWFKLALLVSLISVALVPATLVNQFFAIVALLGVSGSIGAWSFAITWDRLFRAVASTVTDKHGLGRARAGVALYLVALVASIALTIVSASSRPPTYTFDRWGISFSYPSDWTSLPDSHLNQMKLSVESQLTPYDRTLEELEVFQSPQDDFLLMVAKGKTDAPLSLPSILQERKGVLEAAQNAGDVTKVNLLEQTTIGAGVVALIEDVERGGHGRGRSFSIPSAHYLFTVSFIVLDKALFEKYSTAIDKVVASLKVEPQR